MITQPRPLLLPFNRKSAIRKVPLADDAWEFLAIPKTRRWPTRRFPPE